MKPTFARAIGAFAAVTALVVAGWPPWPLHAQANAPVISTQLVSSAASSGTSSTLALDGKYSNCAVYAQTSTATATVLANGNTFTGQYGPGSPYTQVGSVTATTTESATQFNMAPAPVGFFFTWSGNSGTLTVWATCSANTSTNVTATVSIPTPLLVNFTTPLPVTQASVPWSVSCLAAYPCGLPTPNPNVQPSPLYTTPVSCAAAANCPVNASQVTSPWIVNTPVPAVTSAAGTTAVALCDGTTATTCGKVSNASGSNQSAAFAPFVQSFQYFWNGSQWQVVPSVSPAPYPVHASVKVGNSTDLFLDTVPEGVTITGTISTATTTLLFAGVANQNMYFWFASFVPNGVNASNTVQLVQGQTTSTPCDTSQTPINAVAYAPSTASGGMSVFYGGFQQAAATVTNAIIPASVPMIIKANATPFNVCIKTTGTTTAGVGVILAVNHAN